MSLEPPQRHADQPLRPCRRSSPGTSSRHTFRADLDQRRRGLRPQDPTAEVYSLESLAADCPHLQDRLGENCSENDATALLFNRSY